MAFRDWVELDQAQGLELPINGKIYQIASPPARIGLRVQAFMQTVMDAATSNANGDVAVLDEQALDDAAELDLFRDVLGPTYAQMEADSVPTEAVKHAALTTMVWITVDRQAAEAVWEGKAPAAAARSRSAAANGVRSPASTSGTSTPLGSGQPNRKGRRSRGRKS